MPYEIKNDFVIFKSTFKEKLLKEMDGYLAINPHTKIFKQPTYDIVKLEWSSVVIQKPHTELEN